MLATLKCFNVLDTKAYAGNIAIKFDFRKTFDTLDWSFLVKTLSAFGFYDKLIDWIWRILLSARLSIKINGAAHGFFECRRGVSQGNPLSPLLFCIIVSRRSLNWCNKAFCILLLFKGVSKPLLIFF